jgi:serine/threonine protein kinase
MHDDFMVGLSPNTRNKRILEAQADLTLTEYQIAKILVQLTSLLAYLHRKGVVLRSLRLDNVMIEAVEMLG